MKTFAKIFVCIGGVAAFYLAVMLLGLMCNTTPGNDDVCVWVNYPPSLLNVTAVVWVIFTLLFFKPWLKRQETSNATLTIIPPSK